MNVFLIWMFTMALYGVGAVVAWYFFDRFGLLRWSTVVDFRVGRRLARQRQRRAWIKSQVVVGAVFATLVWFFQDPQLFLRAGRAELLMWVGTVLATAVILQAIAWLIARRLSGACARRKSYCRQTQE